MYLVIIGWLYVAMMMSVAEATNTTGSILGAMVTFVLYGLVPIALLMYLMGTPGRKRAIKAREAAEAAEAAQAARQSQQAAAVGAAAGSGEPDAGGETPADAVAPVRKEP